MDGKYMKDGTNPMRWDCKKNGCFNIIKRPRIELLAQFAPGRCGFGDIDGALEQNGYLLLLEMKPAKKCLTRGQEIMYERITRGGTIAVCLISGDPQTMRTDSLTVWSKGQARDVDLVLGEVIRRWCEIVNDSPRAYST